MTDQVTFCFDETGIIQWFDEGRNLDMALSFFHTEHAQTLKYFNYSEPKS